MYCIGRACITYTVDSQTFGHTLVDMDSQFKFLLRPERSEGLDFFNEALDRGYAQFQWACRNLLISLPDLDETGLK